MGIKNTILSLVASTSILAGANDCIGRNGAEGKEIKLPQVEQTSKPEVKDSTIINTQKEAEKQIFLCLDVDDEDSYTHTKAIESITDPENTILEYPIAQLYQKFGKNKQPHPLKVSGVAPRLRSLLGRGGIEASDTPQKLNPRQGEITSETVYEVGDTLSFRPIDSRLVGAFPMYLKDQLSEEGFETFHDKDSLVVNTPKDENKQRKRNPENIGYQDIGNDNKEEKLINPYIYDIVVKSLPGGKSALALYRDGKLFMATYVSIGTYGRKTRTGQFEILGNYPYKRSIKYENSPMPLALHFVGGFYFHQGNVTGNPLSHGCVRMPGVYVDVLYSCVKDKDNVDVFIDKNLYKSK